MNYDMKEFEDYYMFTFNPNQEQEINIPYVLYLPKENVNSNIGISFETPSTFSNENLENIFDKLKDEVKYQGYFKYNNMPCIVPLIPRFDKYPMTYLTKSVHDNKTELIDDSLTAEEKEQMKDIDTQVHNIIENSKSFLNNMGYDVEDKVVAKGYSAASKFANLYTYLHPEDVSALIAGGTTGLQIRPMKEINGEPLNFPLGINDVPDNVEEFSKIPQFYYMGNEDMSDPALCKCELDDQPDVYGNPRPKINSDGSMNAYIVDDKLQAYYSNLYSDNEVNSIYNNFGVYPQDRFTNAAKCYEEYGINATCKMYDGDHMTVNMNQELQQDILVFMNENVLNKSKINKVM